MANYHKGRAFEYQVKKRLLKDGYTVFRFAGSKPLDLVALRNGKVMFCECKTYRATIEDKEKVGAWANTLGYPVCLFEKNDDVINVLIFEPKLKTGKNIYAMLDDFIQWLQENFSGEFPNGDYWVNLSQLDSAKAIWGFLKRGD
ncbi:MAG: hypothetical protein ACE14S_10345 [Candidatus Bathyarchaeia archaeon]